MEQLALLLHQYRRFDLAYNPFTEDELPCVSVLSAAAARANFLPMAEHWTEKLRNPQNTELATGRGDLWLVRDSVRYSFEFKRSYTEATLDRLARVMKDAKRDLSCLTGNDCDHAFACVITPWSDAVATDTYTQFADHEFAYAIGGGTVPDAYLYFTSRKW